MSGLCFTSGKGVLRFPPTFYEVNVKPKAMYILLGTYFYDPIEFVQYRECRSWMLPSAIYDLEHICDTWPMLSMIKHIDIFCRFHILVSVVSMGEKIQSFEVAWGSQLYRVHTQGLSGRHFEARPGLQLRHLRFHSN